jgi:hypothetical protein
VDDTAEIISILQRRFPDIRGPAKEDICYATTNRQAAVKAIAARSDLVVVVGAPNSSNSQRLREVAERSGAQRAVMVQRGADLDLALVQGCKTVGVTAGASAPEVLVEEVIARLSEAYALEIEEVFRTHPAIADCAAVGLPDEEWGERVAIAWVADSADRPTDAEFRTWGKERLAPAKVPFDYLCISELPRNPMGKIIKAAVKELFG